MDELLTRLPEGICGLVIGMQAVAIVALWRAYSEQARQNRKILTEMQQALLQRSQK